MSDLRSEIREYLTPERLEFISVLKIEKKANIPLGTLRHFLKGRRALNDGHLAKITKIINILKWK